MKKVIFYFLLVLCTLYLLRMAHYRILRSQKQGYYASYRQCFLGKNSNDVLFLGSSRVQMHYNTKLFDELTGANSLNLSMAGATPKVAFLALKTYLQQSDVPRYLFVEMDFHFLKHPCTELKDVGNYFPFLADPNFRNNFSIADKRLSHFYYNPFYSWPFVGTKNLSTAMHICLDIPGKTDTLFYKGYFYEVLKPALKEYKPEPEYQYFHPREREYLDSVFTLAKINNINIFLITSPMLMGGEKDVLNKKQITQQLQYIALKNKTTYYNLSGIPCSSSPAHFVDNFHMNAAGASEFTSHLAELFLTIKTEN